MKNVLCTLFGHKWKTELLKYEGTLLNSYAVVERCERCRILHVKDWTMK